MEELRTRIMKMLNRPDVLPGRTNKIECGCGRLYITSNRDWETSKVAEVFVKMGKCGGCKAASFDVIGRLASRSLRYGAPLLKVARDMRGVVCEKPIGLGPHKIQSCMDAVGKVLMEEAEWEKTDGFKEWWRQQLNDAGYKSDSSGRGEDCEVCNGQKECMEEKILDDNCSVEKGGD